MGKYVYKPYHSWRHRRWAGWLHSMRMVILKLILILELLFLAGEYLLTHTSHHVYEREVPVWYEGEECYGIAWGTDTDEMYWFHKRAERSKETEE